MIRLSLFLAGVALLSVGCGNSIPSNLGEAEKQLFDSFVNPDVDALSDEELFALHEVCVKLATGGAAEKMSTEEADRTTAQIEAMIARLERDLSQASGSERGKRLKVMQELKNMIGRGG